MEPRPMEHPTSYVFTFEQIDAASEEKAEIFPWGYKEYVKADGQWQLSHLLITDDAQRISYKVYPDARPMEIIPWGTIIR